MATRILISLAVAMCTARADQNCCANLKAELSSLRKEVAELSSLRKEVAELSSLRKEVAELKVSLHQQQLATGRDNTTPASLHRLHDDAIPAQVAQLAAEERRRLNANAITRDASTSHHVWGSRDVVHQFSDANSCLGGVMTSSYGTVLTAAAGKLQINQKDETEKKLVSPALIMHHAGDCSADPTVHSEHAFHAEGGAHVTGMLTVGNRSISPPEVHVVRPSQTEYPLAGTCDVQVPISGFSKTVTLTETRMVLVHYSISYEIAAGNGWSYLQTLLFRKDNGGSEVEVTDGRSIGGMNQDTYVLGTNSGMWIGELEAGSYEWFVKYRSGTQIAVDINNACEQYQQSMRVLVL